MDELKRLLRLHEGLKLFVYRCTAGKLTIGIGRNLEANPLTVVEREHLAHKSWRDIRELRITTEEAWWLLAEDLARRIPELARALPFFGELDRVRQAVLIDMAYCLGVEGLLLFRRTLQSIASGDYQLAAREMLQSKWATQVGKAPGQRAWRLARMMDTGQWPDDLPL